METKTFFISGASGFIGRYVCEYLKGKNVLLIGRIKIGEPYNHNSYHIDTKVPFVFIHLSAYGNHYFQTDTKEIIQANILDLKKWVDVCNCENLVKFYNISTSSVTLPVQTMYSASKLFGETLINSLNDERFINVRPYSVYGPGEADHRFIPTVIRHLKSGETMELDPNPNHDWIYCEDFVKAMFNGSKEIGSGVQTSNIDIVNILENISGKKLHYNQEKMRDYDTSKWVCPVPVPCRTLHEGLQQTWEFYTK